MLCQAVVELLEGNTIEAGGCEFSIDALGIAVLLYGPMLRNIAREEEMAAVPYVPCPFCCHGWLISSQHRECFDRARQVWRFVCPDCGHNFEVPTTKNLIQNIPLKTIRGKYPRFRLEGLSRLLPH